MAHRNIKVLTVDEKEQKRKDLLENGAFTQQSRYISDNMRGFFFPMFTNPSIDWANLPKLGVYKTFMEVLWAERDTRRDSDSTDFDFSSIHPSDKYLFAELIAEVKGFQP